MQMRACPNCGGPVPFSAPGTVVHCPFCAAEIREEPALGRPAEMLSRGVAATGPRRAQHAVADAAGNVYCAGTVGDERAVWAFDRDLRLRWKVEVVPGTTFACDGLALHASGTVTVRYHGGVRILSAVDGSSLGDAPKPLQSYRQWFLDGDGTYVTATDRVVGRVHPETWQEAALFDGKGLLARMHSHQLKFSGNVWMAAASDGDLVVHHGGFVENEMHYSRFDRHGHRKLDKNVGLQGLYAPKLAAGAGGIVWAKSFRHLRAITDAAVLEVSLPSEELDHSDELQPRPLLDDLDEAFVSMPDGSLLFFGTGLDDGHFIRAATDGPTITRLETLRS